MIQFTSGYTSPIPLNHARIGYQTHPATITGTQGLTYGPDAVLTSNTYERWNPSGSGVITLDFGSSVDISYVALGAISLIGVEVVIAYSNGGATTTVFNQTLTTNDPLMIVFPSVQASSITVFLGGGGEIGVVYCGQVLEMMRGMYAGHTPVTLNRKTVRNLNRSVKGQFLGTSIVRTGLAASYEWSNIPITWYEQNIDPLAVSARTKPFFIAWNPLEHPDHVAYGFSSDDISPTLSGTLNYCNFGFELDGYA